MRSIISEAPTRVSWEADADCRDYDTKLWLLQEDPVVNKENFEKAEVICSTCPVFASCWKYATPTDKLVTMRAGAWPEEYRAPGVKHIYPEKRKGRPRRMTCARSGHDTSYEGSRSSSGQCKACRTELAQLAKEARGG